MTGVTGRLRYSRQKPTKYPDLEQAKKADRKSINMEIQAKTEHEQKQKRIVSVSGRFVSMAATVGLPLTVLVNGQTLANVEPTPESAAACYAEVKNALMQYLDDNRESNLKIEGVLA